MREVAGTDGLGRTVPVVSSAGSEQPASVPDAESGTQRDKGPGSQPDVGPDEPVKRPKATCGPNDNPETGLQNA